VHEGWTGTARTRLHPGMRIGVSLRSAYGPDVQPRQGARMMIERAIAAREAGLESLFVGDHHATGPFPYYQNTPIMGRLLAEWGDKPAGVLMLLPLWDPVPAAEQLGTLASLASGRFVLQCAIGGGEPQFEAMGVSLRERVTRFESGLEIIRRLLAGEKVASAKGPYRFGEARVAPVTPEPLEVWIGASAPKAIDRAARLGDGWLADPSLVPPDAAAQLDQYRERCAAHGRDPGVMAIRRDVHVGADAADADRVAGDIVRGGYRGFAPEATVVGGPDEVVDLLRPYAEMGYTDVIVRHLAEDHAEVLRSVERLATVREALANE
jgi:alkanesulfonate monooxygenase SsuD/methylene tetrahydromethanopterin reductase-like flavin-dependent oxidoreductase (luciferase family)